jgi:hypothetical protein
MPGLRGVGTVLLVAVVFAASGRPRAADPPLPREYPQAESVVRPPDERRPEEPLAVRLFGRPLTVGGELTTETGYEGNFALRRDAADDLAFVDQELELELSYPLARHLSVFVQGVAFYEVLFETERGDRSVESALELSEAWLDAEDVRGSGLSLQLGRLAIWEERNWWWDETVDAVRLRYDRRRLEVQAGVGRDVGRLATEQGGAKRERHDGLQGLGHVAWRWAGNQWLDGFLLYRDGKLPESTVDRLLRADDDETSDAELLWLGARVSGELEVGGRLGELDHLLEGAWVGGHVTPSGRAGMDRSRQPRRPAGTDRDLSGWALIAEGAWETEWPRRPALTIGYAFGSGDGEPGRGTDRTFRQTGLGSNEGRLSGVEYFDYYGELVEPELSNLHVWTVCLGFELGRSSSIVFVHHSYVQVHAAPILRDANLAVDPMGRRRGIGHAWDVVLGLQEWERIEIDLIGSLFRAGPAYGDLSGRMAWSMGLAVELNF